MGKSPKRADGVFDWRVSTGDHPSIEIFQRSFDGWIRRRSFDNQNPLAQPGSIRWRRTRRTAAVVTAVLLAGQAACDRGEPTVVTSVPSDEMRARLAIAPDENLLFDAAAGTPTEGTFVVPESGYLIRYRCVAEGDRHEGPTVQEVWRHGRSSEGAGTTLFCDDTEARSSLEPPAEPGTKIEVSVFANGTQDWELVFVTPVRRRDQ